MKTAEVVLINANLQPAWNPAPAPGLGYLAAVLEKSGVEVRVIDPVPERLSLGEVVEKAAALNPRVVGLTCLTSYRYDTFALADALKARKGDWKIVVGGPHVSFLDEAVLRRIPAIDCVVRGEGEFTFLEYLSSCSPEEIAGLTFRHNGEIIRAPAREPIRNLDSLPFPAYHLFPDLSCYEDIPDVPLEWQHIRHAPIVSSRGCPHGCIFCSSANFWRSHPAFRARSAANIADEMEHLYYNFGARYIQFQDDNFTASKKRVQEICDEILRRGLKVHWRAEARIDGVDRELLRKMAAAGCHEIEYGVESGSPRVMARVGKKIDLSRVPEVARMTRKAGIRAKAFFIVGLPAETKEDFLLSLKVSRHFDYVGVLPLFIFPGSPLCQEMEKEGKITEETWFSDESDNSVLGLERVPLYLGAFSPATLQRLAELLIYYNRFRRRLGLVLRPVNFPHPRRMLHFLRSVGSEYRQLARTAAKDKISLPLPTPAIGAEG